MNGEDVCRTAPTSPGLLMMDFSVSYTAQLVEVTKEDLGLGEHDEALHLDLHHK